MMSTSSTGGFMHHSHSFELTINFTNNIISLIHSPVHHTEYSITMKQNRVLVETSALSYTMSGIKFFF